MGIIAKEVASHQKADDPESGRARWARVFGTDKEGAGLEAVAPKPETRRSVGYGSPESYKRLLQAMRSLAPGGWSDDRWEQSRHFVGIQYVAIHRSGEQLAQSDFQVFVKDPSSPEGKRPVAEDDPPHGDREVRPYDLVKLLQKPNGKDSFGEMMYRWNQQLDLTGTALTWLVPNALGVPYEMYCIPTALAIPQPANHPDYPDGFYRVQPIYPYGPFSSYPTPVSAAGAPVPAKWMLRFQYPHPLLFYEGYAPSTAMNLHLDTVQAIDRSRGYTMKRSINPSAVLNFEGMEGAEPMPEEEIDRIRAEFEAQFQGPENHGQLFVAAPGSSLEPWGAKPIDMEYQSGWDQLVAFILCAYGITKPAAGMIEDSSYATLFATLKQFDLLTLGPKRNRISSQITRFLAPYYGDNLIVEIRGSRIDDHDVKNAKLGVLLQGKAITKNELRRELDMTPTEEDWGDDIAGSDSLSDQQKQQMASEGGGQPGAMGGADPMAEAAAGQPGAEQTGTEPWADPVGRMANGNTPADPEGIEASRPRPGNLGLGSLGPRKHLSHNGKNGVAKKRR